MERVYSYNPGARTGLYWSFARLIAPVVTTISIFISSNKIQNGISLPRLSWKTATKQLLVRSDA